MSIENLADSVATSSVVMNLCLTDKTPYEKSKDIARAGIIAGLRLAASKCRGYRKAYTHTVFMDNSNEARKRTADDLEKTILALIPKEPSND